MKWLTQIIGKLLGTIILKYIAYLTVIANGRRWPMKIASLDEKETVSFLWLDRTVAVPLRAEWSDRSIDVSGG